MKQILFTSVILVALLLSACGAPVPTPKPTPTPKATQPISTADLQKQINRLNQRMEDLEGRVGGRGVVSLFGSLERRVSALEEKVGGGLSLGGDSLSSLQRRVSALEGKVGGGLSLGGDSLSRLESRVSALERKSGGSRW